VLVGGCTYVCWLFGWVYIRVLVVGWVYIRALVVGWVYIRVLVVWVGVHMFAGCLGGWE